MTLENVYVIPHGDEIIDQPNLQSTELFDEIKKVTSGDGSDTLLLISPHGLRLSKSIGILNTEYLSADLQLKSRKLTGEFQTDRSLVNAILKNSPHTQAISFITSSGPLSRFTLDFGSVIPLYFFNQKNLVAIGQPRIWDSEMLQGFGRTLARVVSDLPQKVSIIISADQAHAHNAVGPYGYSEKSAVYETMIENCFRDSDFNPLTKLTEEFVEEAKPDSFWNMLILKGIMDETGLKSVLDYHYVEIYFGMLLGHLEKP